VKNRKPIISTAVILAVALAGLALININQTAAVSQTAASAMSQATTDTTAAAETAPVFETTALPAIGKMVGALVVVIICIYLAVFLLRRVTGGRFRGKGGSRLLEVLESAYVAPKKTISLVRVADKSILIGVTENSMAVLTELDADQTAVALSGSEETTTEDNFDRLFVRAFGKLRRLTPRKAEAALDS